MESASVQRTLRSKHKPNQLHQREIAIYHLKEEQDPDNFQVKQIPGKGRGIVTEVKRQKGDFLLPYAGESITHEEGEKREEELPSVFRFFYFCRAKKHCIDATEESGRLGRLVNHGNSYQINARMTVVEYGDAGEHCGLALFALRSIEEGEEILYDYGINKLPWKDKSFVPGGKPGPAVLFTGLNSEKVKEIANSFFELSNGRYAADLEDATHIICQGDNKNYTNGMTVKMLHSLLKNKPIYNLSWLTQSIEKGCLLNEKAFRIAGDSNVGPWPDVRAKMKQPFTCEVFGDIEGICQDDFVSLIKNMGGRLTRPLRNIPLHVKIADGRLPRFLQEEGLIDKQWLIDSIVFGTLKETETYRIKKLIDLEQDYSPSDNSMSEDVDPDARPSDNFMSEDVHQDYRPSDNSMSEDADPDARPSDNSMSEDADPDARPSDNSMSEDVDPDARPSDNSMSEDVDPDARPSDNSMSEDVDHDARPSDNSMSEDVDPDAGPSDNFMSEDVDPDARPSGNFMSEDCGETDQNQEEKKAATSIKFQGVEKNEKGNLKNKLHACFYCEKVLANIARHYQLVHKNELEVANILLFPQKTKQRRSMWEKLVNKGNFAHNIEVIEKGEGLLIPKKRSKKQTAGNFVPCQYCKGFYKKNDLWKHSAFCVAKGTKKIKDPVKNGRMLLPVKNCSEKFTRTVLHIMREDKVKLTIESDQRILMFGNRLFAKQGHEQHKIHYICQKLRELGRLLLKCRSLSDSIKSLDDLLHTKNWDILVKGVKSVAGFNEATHSLATPSLALKIGHSIQKCAKYLRSEGSKEENTEKERRAESFLKIYETDWNDEVSSIALTTLSENNFNKTLLLPIVEDVVKLNAYLNQEIENISKAINDGKMDRKNYSRLAELCLAMLILFNRRRSGETERMTLKSFIEAKIGKPDAVVLSTLNEFEKKLCTTHTRIEIKGKRGRKVAVLLTEKMKQYIELLVSLRSKVSVTKDLLFSKPGNSRFPFRGSDCLRKFAEESHLENPSAITSTKLRKQLATLAQILNLSESSQDILATFQGHDIRIHREFYRLPENTMQVAKVSKILHSLNNGTIAKYKGQDFNDIELADQDALESESSSSASSEDQEVSAEGDEEVKDTKTPKGRTVQKPRHHWTTEEKRALSRQFKKNIAAGKTPGQLECLNGIRLESSLKKFGWKQIKFAVKNLITTQIRRADKYQKKN